MKTLLIIIFLFLTFSVKCQNIYTFDSYAIDNIAILEQKSYYPDKYYSKKILDYNYDINYCRFKWEIDPDVLFIKGEVTTCFVTTQTNVTNISFDLSSGMIVDSVKFHNSLISYSQAVTNILSLEIPVALPLNCHDSISVYYHGVPQTSGFGAFMKSEHNGIPIISTLSEPYGAMEWFPCKNDLTDKIDSIDIFITTPVQYRSASNGMLISETLQNGKKTAHWKHHYPIATYLIAIAVTNYAVYSDYYHKNGDTIEILNYVYPEDSAEIRRITPDTYYSLNLYDSLFGTYPFINERYGHAQFSAGGGMEHQTMTFLGYFSGFIIWHELAHQWFGDMVTCGSWHDIWLNEGFATYLTGLCHEKIDQGIWWNRWKAQTLSGIVKLPGGSVYVEDTTSVSRIFDPRLSYSKGAYILHQLRWILGDSLFYQSIRNYLNDPAFKYRFAWSEDLIRHFENTCDTSLTDYFNSWLYGQGYPSYQIECIKEGNGSIVIAVNQMQSHPSVDFFKLPLPVKFKSNNGNDTIVVLKNTFNGQIFSVKLGFDPDSVFFDPDLWLITNNNSIFFNDCHYCKYDIQLYPNPAKDILYIKTSGIHPDKIEILNLEGKILPSKCIIDNQSNISQADISLLSDGAYIVRIFYENIYLCRKFTKVSN